MKNMLYKAKGALALTLAVSICGAQCVPVFAAEALSAAQQGVQPKKERNASAPAAKDGAAQPKPNNQKNRRGYRGYHGKPRPKTGAPGDKPQS